MEHISEMSYTAINPFLTNFTTVCMPMSLKLVSLQTLFFCFIGFGTLYAIAAE